MRKTAESKFATMFRCPENKNGEEIGIMAFNEKELLYKIVCWNPRPENKEKEQGLSCIKFLSTRNVNKEEFKASISFEYKTTDEIIPRKNIMKLENELISYGQCLQNDLIIFYRTDPNTKEKKILNLCQTISGILENVYPTDKLQFWDGNLSFFEKFRKKVALFFKMSTL